MEVAAALSWIKAASSQEGQQYISNRSLPSEVMKDLFLYDSNSSILLAGNV